MIHSQISLLRTSDRSSDDRKRNYQFLHLTFQEYFAARYFVKQWSADEKLEYVDFNTGKSKLKTNPRTFVQQHKYTAHYDVVWRFVAGLLAVEGAEIQSFFRIIEEEPVDLLGPTHQRLVMHCLSEVDTSTELPNRSKIKARLSEWLLFECALTGYSLIARKSEYPDEALHTALELGSGNAKRIILEALSYSQRHLLEATLGVVAALLKDKDQDVRSSAAKALGGQANLIDVILESIGLLKEPKNSLILSL